MAESKIRVDLMNGARKLETQTSVSDAPYGWVSVPGTHPNNPFSFWFSLLTIQSSESGYTVQIGIPWQPLDKPKYRVHTGTSWTGWLSFA